MSVLEGYFIVFVIIQLIHSHEEMLTRFDRYWPLWKMSRRTFVTFEYIFSSLLLLIIFIKEIPYREQIMLGFNLLMFANGIWHLMWAGIVKKYVPGLITAPLFIIVFIVFYYSLTA